jgi:hypothetical protein
MRLSSSAPAAAQSAAAAPARPRAPAPRAASGDYPAAAALNGAVPPARALPVPPAPGGAAAPPPPPPPPPARAPRSYRVSLFDALKFNGPAPEKINGRVAMVTLLAAAHREAATGEAALAQLAAPDDWVLGALCLVVSYASMQPVLAGAIEEDLGWLSARAERVNGRAAMLGWAALLALEAGSGGLPFF